MTALPRLHLPMRRPADVIPHLGAEHHYQDGRSARLIAETWFTAQQQQPRGLPATIREVLGQDPRLADAELVDAFLERRIDLGDGRKASQADALIILGLPSALAVMAIEGKVDETFGPRISEWLGGSPSAGKVARLARLCATLGLDPSLVGALRYQLLHRTASAVYEAKRYRSSMALMVVHSFDPGAAGLPDFRAFAAAIGLPAVDAARLAGPIVCDGVDLFLGWTPGGADLEQGRGAE